MNFRRVALVTRELCRALFHVNNIRQNQEHWLGAAAASCKAYTQRPFASGLETPWPSMKPCIRGTKCSQEHFSDDARVLQKLSMFWLRVLD